MYISAHSLTWDELADIYDKSTGGRARTLKMNQVFEWAERQADRFFVSEDGSLHQVNTKRQGVIHNG